MKNISKKALSLALFLSLFGLSLLEAEEAMPESKSSASNDPLKIVTANINLMPKGLNIVTSGNPNERARQIAESLLRQHPNTDLYFLQEMYDDAPSNALIARLKEEGFDYYPGPTRRQLQEYWRKKYRFVLGAAKNSGQGIFIRRSSGLKVESYDVFAFVESGIEGIGLLEAFVPKGVIHVKLSHKQEGAQAISIFGHHLQAEIGLFALSRFLHRQWLQLPKTIASDIVHLQQFQKLREKYPNYLEAIRKRQIAATMNWIQQLKNDNKVADQIVHIGDFNLIAGSPEYKRLLTAMKVVPATDQPDLVTICNPENTTWGKWTKPLYGKICRYINNYGWMDLGLVSPNLRSKVNEIDVVDLKTPQGKSVTDHESVTLILDNVFKK